jgi:hypothetical protein
MRILQENVTAGFVPCRNGVVTDNIFVFTSSMRAAVNIGGNTAPGTFTFARNWWYCMDNPAASAPTLPVAENGGHVGVDPRFVDAAHGDFHLQSGSPANVAGAYAGSGTTGTTTGGTTGGTTGTTGGATGGTTGGTTGTTGGTTGGGTTGSSTGGAAGRTTGSTATGCGFGGGVAVAAALALLARGSRGNA